MVKIKSIYWPSKEPEFYPQHPYEAAYNCLCAVASTPCRSNAFDLSRHLPHLAYPQAHKKIIEIVFNSL